MEIPCKVRPPWRPWTSMCTWTSSPIPAPPSPTCCCPPARAGRARPSDPSFDGSADVATWVQLRQAVVAPVAQSRPDLEILFDLAQRLGLGTHFCHGDIEAAFNEQLAPSGLTVQQLRAHPLGMRVEIPTRYQKYAEIEAQTGQAPGLLDPHTQDRDLCDALCQRWLCPAAGLPRAARKSRQSCRGGPRVPARTHVLSAGAVLR